jgi:anthranilate synthase/aminodeoxychorismate synthase-like glutamine amidotransferase
VPVRILMIDNHDSFTWNLVQGLEALGTRVSVVRNDAEPPGALVARAPHGVVLSPGPGTPEQAGHTIGALQAFSLLDVPLFGVCLGHQALAVAFGGRVVRSRAPRHGKTVAVRHDGGGVFAGLPDPIEAMLYHSLVADEAAMPSVLAVSARGPEGEVMGLRHRALPLEGVQFHPESIGTPEGRALLANFVARCASRAAGPSSPAHGAAA